VDVGQAWHVGLGHGDAPYHEERPVRALFRQPFDEIELDPFLDEPEEPDDGARQPGDVVRDAERGILRLDEVVVVDAVRADVRVGVEGALLSRSVSDATNTRLARRVSVSSMPRTASTSTSGSAA
jgi:hypothetical protein